ncbi:MFS transporter [Streptomyces sp. NBC_01089]|uniref:MFS transporter n=1 Tax=Streptomyces sp. NBC_01089 TaxID=2903747 RepID=UPI003870A169|nr:MFS transporter [Streptomyces sp. NBC_01089]
MGLRTTADPAPGGCSPAPAVSRRYAWVVFALSFGLLLSDYMSRQVLNSVFPLLKAEWGLTDAQLGSLSGVVALAVGVLTFPTSFLADRWGRVRSLVLAAVVWSLATLACAVAAGYGQMFLARLFVGIGEAAYGSVGIALVLSVFPARLRATLSGAFMGGGSFGSVLGVALSGVIAQHFGWRWAFGVMGFFGLGLAVAFAVVVTERRLDPRRDATAGRREEHAKVRLRSLLPQLFSSVSVVSAYAGSGLQLFLPGALLAWLPSFFNRYYHMSTGRAGVTAGLFALLTGVGMVLGGVVADRVGRTLQIRKWATSIVCSLLSLVLLSAAFGAPTGTVQMLLLAAGSLVSGATAGPAAAMVANLTPGAISGTAFGTLTLANSLLGLAPGSAVTGMVADRLGLLAALRLMPLVAAVAALCFAVGRRHYERDIIRLAARATSAATRTTAVTA